MGRSLKANEFTFEMKDSAGTVVATGTNDANGVVTFNQLPKSEKMLKLVKQLSIMSVKKFLQTRNLVLHMTVWLLRFL